MDSYEGEFLQPSDDEFEETKSLPTVNADYEKGYAPANRVNEDLKRTLEKMPTCSERSLLELISLIQDFLQNSRSSTSPTDPSSSDEIIKQLQEGLKHFKYRLEREYMSEELKSVEIAELMAKIERKVVNTTPSTSNFDWQILADNFKFLLQIFRPVDFEKMFRLMNETKIGEQMIKNKDIILLLGKTGSGKSTTAHYLAGSPMIQIGNSIDVDEAQAAGMNNDLRKIRISASANSETKFLTPAEIDLRKTLNRSGTVYLCDTPGFDDTEGPEVDIANSYGLIQAIRTCATVRLVPVINYDGMEGRLDGVIDMAQLIVSMATNIYDIVDPITYVYTKFPSDFDITNMLEKAVERQGLADQIKDIILDMISKSKRDRLLVQPLNREGAARLLRSILALNPLSAPGDKFKKFSTSKSMTKIKQQLSKHEKAIVRAWDRNDAELVEYKLHQLKELMAHFPTLTFIEDQYQSVVNEMSRYCEDLFKSSLAAINSQISAGNRLTDGDIQLYRKAIDKFKLFKPIIASHFEESKRTDYEKYLFEHIVDTGESICKGIQEASVDCFGLEHLLDNIHLLVDNFGDLVKPAYKKLYDAQVARYEKVTNELRAVRDPLDTSSITDKLRTLRGLVTIISACAERQNIRSDIDIQSCGQFVLNQIERNSFQLLGQYGSAGFDQKIGEFISKLTDAIADSGFCVFVNKKQLQEVKNSIIGKLSEKLDELSKQIAELAGQETKDIPFEGLKPMWEEVEKLAQISGFETSSMQRLNYCKDNIDRIVTNMNDDISSTILSFNDGQENENFEKIGLYFQVLREATWLDRVRPHLKSASIKKNELNLLKQVTGLSKKLLKMDLSLQDHDNISDSFLYYNKIKLIEPLGKSNAELSKFITPAIEHFEENISEAFESMRKAVSVAELSFSAQVGKLDELKANKSGMENEYLEEAVRDQEKLIEKMKSANHEFLFPRLDGSFFNAAINFLTEVERNEARLYRTEASDIKRDMHDYLFRYSRFVENEFISSIRLIDSRADRADQITENQVKLVVQSMNNYLRDLSALRDQHPAIFEKLDFENKASVLDQLNEHLKIYARSLFEKMSNLQLNGDNFRLNIHMSNAHVLSYLDSRIERDVSVHSFGNMYSTFSNQSFIDAKESITQINLYLARNEYRGIALELTGIENMKISMSSLNQMRHSISMSIQSLIDQARSHERRIDRNLDAGQAEALAEKLRVLKVADTELYILINESSESNPNSNIPRVLTQDVKKQIKEVLEFMSSRLRKKFASYLESITSAIDRRDFQQAEIIRSKYELVYIYLGDYLIPSAQPEENLDAKFADIEAKFDAHLDETVNTYVSMPVEGYLVNCPRSLIERLEKACSAKRTRYQDAIEKIKDSIIRNVRQFMRFEQGPASSDPKGSSRDHVIYSLSPQGRFDFVESLLWYLPEQLEQHLKRELDIVRKEYERLHKRKIEEVKQILDQNDAERLRQFLENNQDFENTIFDAKQQIVSFLQNISLEMVSEVTNNGVSDRILYNLQLLVSFNEKLKARIPEIVSSYQKIDIAIKRNFNGIIKELADIDSIQSDSPVELLEKKFSELLTIIEFANHVPRLVDIEPEALAEQITRLFAFFENNYNDFIQALDEPNANVVVQKYKMSAKWSGIFKKLLRAPLNQAQKKKADQMIHTKLAPVIQSKANQFVTEVQAVNIDDVAVFKYQPEREKIFSGIKNKMAFCKSLERYSDFQNHSGINLVALNQELENRVKSIGTTIETRLQAIVSNREIAIRDFKTLRIQFENLVSFEKFFGSGSADIRQNLIGKCADLAAETGRAGVGLKAVANCFITLQRYSDHLPSLKSEIEDILTSALNAFRKNSSCGKLIELCSELESDEVGASIVSKYEVFKGELIAKFFEKTKGHDIKYVVEKLEGDAIDKAKLSSRFSSYETVYNTLLRKHLTSTNYVQLIKDGIDQIVPNAMRVPTWNEQLKDMLPGLVAHIAALWTLKNKKYYDEVDDLAKRESYLMKPHPVQVVAIFRLLGIGHTQEAQARIVRQYSNLVQVSTGEGKSVVLAITAVVLALLGKEVSCACYSEYLSKRDFENFREIFDDLGVGSSIFYGTFNKLCERLLNERFDIRQQVTSLIKNNQISINKAGSIVKTKVLLIDEVDVFFSKDFLGKVYVPTAQLKDPVISDLLDLIWKSKDSSMSLASLKTTAQYENCKKQFPDWMDLIDESIKNLWYDLKSYKTHQYLVIDDKIAYEEQDGVSFNTVYGYKTLFAYYHEHERRKISKKSLDEYKSIDICSGYFSYSEISDETSNRFKLVLGVSGTLKTLNQSQKDFIKENYKIEYHTYMPSVYGQNKCDFKTESATTIHNKDDYTMRLREEIERRILGTKTPEFKRAVLVFFETKKSLFDFYDSSHVRDIQSAINIITEETSPADKEIFIKEATRSGQITVMTRVFGRGIDFICRNQTMLSNGGVHVIQTFLSEDLSEEVQIRGRTARQGEDGSYSMVLMDEELEVYLGNDCKTKVEDMRRLNKVYDTLNQARNKYFAEANKQLFASTGCVKKDHKMSEQFLKNLENAELPEIRKFLLDNNQGTTLFEKSRTICLMDATGSMTNLLANAKNTVCTMFERIRDILTSKSISPDSFELQFAVYRDYDNMEKILQASGFESNPHNLRQFMETIKPLGNSTGHEAVEIGLWHATQQALTSKISQVILIGDAPAKQANQIENDRKKFGGEIYWQAKFGPAADFNFQTKKLIEACIPVFTFYLHDWAKMDFLEIAQQTGGSCTSMDVSSEDTADLLTDHVSVRVLHDLSAKNGGVDLVGEYVRKYGKSYK